MECEIKVTERSFYFYSRDIACIHVNISNFAVQTDAFMKILVINASPRRGGNVSKMLSLVSSEAAAEGADVTIMNVSDLSVRPCTGCMACRSSHACVLPDDDARRVLEAICGADVLVIGSPCYWGNMPGSLKLVFDRIVYGMMGETRRGLPLPLLKGKRAALVVTCTTPWPWNILFGQSRGTVKAIREILKWSGFRIVSVIEKGGTKGGKGLSDKDKKACRKLARRITER